MPIDSIQPFGPVAPTRPATPGTGPNPQPAAPAPTLTTGRPVVQDAMDSLVSGDLPKVAGYPDLLAGGPVRSSNKTYMKDAKGQPTDAMESLDVTWPSGNKLEFRGCFPTRLSMTRPDGTRLDLGEGSCVRICDDGSLEYRPRNGPSIFIRKDGQIQTRDRKPVALRQAQFGQDKMLIWEAGGKIVNVQSEKFNAYQAADGEWSVAGTGKWFLGDIRLEDGKLVVDLTAKTAPVRRGTPTAYAVAAQPKPEQIKTTYYPNGTRAQGGQKVTLPCGAELDEAAGTCLEGMGQARRTWTKQPGDGGWTSGYPQDGVWKSIKPTPDGKIRFEADGLVKTLNPDGTAVMERGPLTYTLTADGSWDAFQVGELKGQFTWGTHGSCASLKIGDQTYRVQNDSIVEEPGGRTFPGSLLVNARRVGFVETMPDGTRKEHTWSLETGKPFQRTLDAQDRLLAAEAGGRKYGFHYDGKSLVKVTVNDKTYEQVGAKVRVTPPGREFPGRLEMGAEQKGFDVLDLTHQPASRVTESFESGEVKQAEYVNPGRSHVIQEGGKVKKIEYPAGNLSGWKSLEVVGPDKIVITNTKGEVMTLERKGDQWVWPYAGKDYLFREVEVTPEGDLKLRSSYSGEMQWSKDALFQHRPLGMMAARLDQKDVDHMRSELARLAPDPVNEEARHNYLQGLSRMLSLNGDPALKKQAYEILKAELKRGGRVPAWVEYDLTTYAAGGDAVMKAEVTGLLPVPDAISPAQVDRIGTRVSERLRTALTNAAQWEANLKKGNAAPMPASEQAILHLFKLLQAQQLIEGKYGRHVDQDKLKTKLAEAWADPHVQKLLNTIRHDVIKEVTGLTPAQAGARQMQKVTNPNFVRRLMLMSPEERNKVIDQEMAILNGLQPGSAAKAFQVLRSSFEDNAARMAQEQAFVQMKELIRKDPKEAEKALKELVVGGLKIGTAAHWVAEGIAAAGHPHDSHSVAEHLEKAAKNSKNAEEASHLRALAKHFHHGANGIGVGLGVLSVFSLGLSDLSKGGIAYAKAGKDLLHVGRGVADTLDIVRALGGMKPETLAKTGKVLKVMGPVADFACAGIDFYQSWEAFEKGHTRNGWCKLTQGGAGVAAGVAGIAILAGASGPAAPLVLIGAAAVGITAWLFEDSEQELLLKDLKVYK